MATTLVHFLGVFLFLFLLALFHPFMVQSRSLKPKSDHSLKFLQNLEGIQKGDSNKDLPAIRNYLKAFGYFDNGDSNSSSNLLNEEIFDEGLESAIKKFQQFYNLNVSGKLDFDTIKLISTPRCGVPDHVSHSSNLNNSKYKFFDGNPTWPTSKFHLTYSIQCGVPDGDPVPLDTLRYALNYSFGVWSSITLFTFTEVPRGTPSDLVIGFQRLDHGDGFPFDGPGNVLGHSFAPTDGRMHLDADENWSTDAQVKSSQYDLIWVVIHEIGHLLGLQHSVDTNAIMYAYMTPGVNKDYLGEDDIDGIKALYKNL
ncbi:hypothetical protein L6164_017080 [Bauhinia variegata]|uniref:Uncharacterized protein n=1 Tax=Bauhinia variegata TaxID=167791 RepID=A0ACB9N8B4_BAUVA|nr:hypothetical protein L6164_017080 [Bauhinia variegata]